MDQVNFDRQIYVIIGCFIKFGYVMNFVILVHSIGLDAGSKSLVLKKVKVFSADYIKIIDNDYYLFELAWLFLIR